MKRFAWPAAATGCRSRRKRRSIPHYACPAAFASGPVRLRTPFRRTHDLKTGIDLPDYSLADLRERTIAAAQALVGPARVLVLACEHGGGATYPGRVPLPCVAMAPPSLIDYVLSKKLAEGVMVAGCAERACFNRLGIVLTEQRFAQQRDPYLRARVPRDRVTTVWTSILEFSRFKKELGRFAAKIAALPPIQTTSSPPPKKLLEIAAGGTRSGRKSEQTSMIDPIKMVGQLIVIGALFAGVAVISNRPVYRQTPSGTGIMMLAFVHGPTAGLNVDA